MKSLIIISFKSFFSKRNAVVLLFCGLLTIGLLIEGLTEYRRISREIVNFTAIEKAKVEKYENLTQYGMFGFRVLFVPSGISVFLGNSGAFNELHANIETSGRMRMYIPFKGSIVFKGKGKFTDFTGYLLFICSIAALLWGYDTFRRGDYIRLILLGKMRTNFWRLIVARLLPILVYFVVLYAGGLLFILITAPLAFNFQVQLLAFPLILLILNAVFFFISGVAAASIKSRFLSLIAIFSIWIAAIFVGPYTVHKIISLEAEMASVFQLEFKKLEFITQFERRAKKNYGVYTKKKGKTLTGKQLLDSYRDKEFKKLHDLELLVKKKMENVSNIYYSISSFLPTTFYLSVCDGISSQGYLSYISYHDYVRKLDKDFTDFFLAQRHEQPGLAKSFIKGNENIFFSRGMLPPFFFGMCIAILYIAALYWYSYTVYGKDYKKPGTGGGTLLASSAKTIVLTVCRDERLRDDVFYSNETGDKICLRKIKYEHLKLPGIKPYDLFRHLCRLTGADPAAAFENLKVLVNQTITSGKEINSYIKKRTKKNEPGKLSTEREDTRELILKMAFAAIAGTDKETVIINDIIKRESREFERDILRLLEHLMRKGKRVTYLSSEMFQTIVMDERICIRDCENFSIDPDNVSLR